MSPGGGTDRPGAPAALPWRICLTRSQGLCGLIFRIEQQGLFRKTCFQGEEPRAGAHNVSLPSSVWELSPTVCGDMNRKSSLLLKDAQTRWGRQRDRQSPRSPHCHGHLWGSFPGLPCWGADLPL